MHVAARNKQQKDIAKGKEIVMRRYKILEQRSVGECFGVVACWVNLGGACGAKRVFDASESHQGLIVVDCLCCSIVLYVQVLS